MTPPPEQAARGGWRLPSRRTAGIALIALLLLAVILIATFPVGWAKDRLAHRLAERVGAPVSIGSLTREPFFSFKPTVIIRDVRIAQPRWAGSGDLARVREVRMRVPVLPALIGRGLQPDSIEAQGLVANLVRDAQGRSNWGGRKEGGGGGLALRHLLVPDGRFTLRDARRHLALSGDMRVDARGLLLVGDGRFHEAPAHVRLEGPAIMDRGDAEPYPFVLTIASPLLDLRVDGRTNGAFNIRDMTLEMAAQAPSLKYLDDIIRAGLFGTQPIDLRAQVRHSGHDWFVDRLSGRVGRSTLTGRAQILKRDGRSKIDGTVDFATLDFDDLADDAGLAAGAALEARIGERVLPNTRINLSKVGPTDGQIRLTAHKLLFKTPSVFQSLKGIIRLEGKLLTVDQVEARLTNGRMTGRLMSDHRTGASPLLTVDLLFSDGRLGPLLNATDKLDAPFRARLRLSGRGDTIREALSRSDGQVGLAAGKGHVSRLAASVLAQDMGKTLGAVIDGGDENVPLNCVAIGFSARAGNLTAAPFLIDTAIARSRGTGAINLDGETIALLIGGQSRDSSGLPMIDPIRIDGTLSEPVLSLSATGRRKGIGSIVGAVVKSIGGALGLAEKEGPQVAATGPIDCPALARNVLGAAR